MTYSSNNGNTFWLESDSVLVLSPVSAANSGSTFGCTSSNEWGTAIGPSQTNPAVLIAAEFGSFTVTQIDISYAFVYTVENLSGGLAVPCIGAPASVPAAEFTWAYVDVAVGTEEVKYTSTRGKERSCQNCFRTSRSVQVDEYGGCAEFFCFLLFLTSCSEGAITSVAHEHMSKSICYTHIGKALSYMYFSHVTCTCYV
jgi:hypothetical protein